MGTQKKERKGINQKQKLLYLIKIFSEQTDDDHSLTLAEIIERLHAYGVNADRKTLYTDFEELRDYGFDIIADRDGRIYSYHLGSRTFELAELKLLVDSVQAARFITDKKSTELIKKLESLVSQYDAKKLHRQVVISGRVKTTNERIYYNVDKIHSAIHNGHQIRFKYTQYNLKKELEYRRHGAWYQISPWSLIWDNEYYYVLAYSEEEDRFTHYRVDKMQMIEELSLAREGVEAFRSFDLAHYTKSLFGMYAGEEMKVTLRCNNDMIGIMIDRFGTDIIVIPYDPERFEITVNVAFSTQFIGWIMSLGNGVTIVAPNAAVDRMKQEIDRLHAQYN